MGEYKPGYWLNGWTPESVAEDFGLNLDDWEERDDKEDDKLNTLHGVKEDDLIPLSR